MNMQKRLAPMALLGFLMALTFGIIACGDKKPAADAKKDEKISAESAAKEKDALDTAVKPTFTPTRW